jgi:putative FmdB family regulatory protein
VPLYEYACLKCGRHTDKIEPVAGPHLRKCPHCGSKVESVITAPAIKFKGSGWYINDYAAKPTGEGKKAEGAAGNSGDSKESAAKDSGSKDSKDSGSKESSSKESPGKHNSSKESSSSKDSKETKSPAAKKD